MYRIREAREKIGLKQKEVAEILNVTPATYSRYESGIIRPDPTMLLKISEILNTSVDYLLGRDGSGLSGEKSNKLIENIDLSNFEIDIIKKIKLLNNKGRDKLCMYLDDLLENPSNVSNDNTVKNEDVS